MLQYCALIKKFYPISHLWPMIYEAKHSTTEVAARSTFNSCNITGRNTKQYMGKPIL